jgi:hypothetical protein
VPTDVLDGSQVSFEIAWTGLQAILLFSANDRSILMLRGGKRRYVKRASDANKMPWLLIGVFAA